jgi:hypothetical protein
MWPSAPITAAPHALQVPALGHGGEFVMVMCSFQQGTASRA